jgi:osmotically-inducible protein OsmY
MRLLRLIALLVTIAGLAGCAVAVVGAAAGGGAIIGADRRTVGTQTEDQGIEIKVANRVGDKYPDAHINVTSYNRMVLLTGETTTAASRTEIEKIARAVENVRGIYNEVAVVGNSALSARTNDSYITSKVKARFVDAGKFNAVHVKVVTEAGVVYLLGMVTHKEADEATEIARTTSGVLKVVRLFEFID